MSSLAPEYLSSLLVELCKQPAETGWLEFKENNSSPEDIGLLHPPATTPPRRTRPNHCQPRRRPPHHPRRRGPPRHHQPRRHPLRPQPRRLPRPRPQSPPHHRLRKGNNRLKTIREHVVRAGYAAGFTTIIDHTHALLPRTETIGRALRRDVPIYPDEAIRELIPNALIHQDFSITGAGPMIEIFAARMEITNPGAPLVSPDRFLDKPPRSRNEILAFFMRRAGICEERGTGVDKVVATIERHQLPAPRFENLGDSTRALLFAHKELRHMTRAERTQACYLHASLRYIEGNPMTNASLRARFGISEPNRSMASRIIADTVEARLIKPMDPEQGKKYARYVPQWS